MLQYILNHTAPDSPIIHLYTGNVSLPVADPENVSDTDPTECNFTGYTAIGLTGLDVGGGGWTVVQAAGVTTAKYSKSGTPMGVTFSMSTGGDIYGYYVTNAAGNILWIEEFSGAPFSLPVATGGDIAIIPQITLT
jgi:hypothetical protein